VEQARASSVVDGDIDDRDRQRSGPKWRPTLLLSKEDGMSFNARRRSGETVTIFRWCFRHPKTGKLIRGKRPFPIKIRVK
jgi:hypothetical protein